MCSLLHVKKWAPYFTEISYFEGGEVHSGGKYRPLYGPDFNFFDMGCTFKGPIHPIFKKPDSGV